MRINKLTQDLLCLLLGALLPLAFAPFNWYPLAFLIPGALIPLWTFATPQRALWRGWLFGLGFFGVGTSWVFVSIHVYGHAPLLLAGFLTLLFTAFLALYTAAQAWVYRRLFPEPSALSWCLGFAALWGLAECFRGWFLSGFPWLFLGYSQIDSPLAGFIPIVGVYGTSALAVAISGLFAYGIFRQAQKRWISVCAALAILALGFGLHFIQWTQPAIDKKVTLIQGNVPQEQKWDVKFVQSIVERYDNLTAQHWDSDIIIWPEASLPIPLPDSAPIVAALAHEAEQHHVTLIIGLLELSKQHGRFYNAVLATGTGHGIYHKRQLVPFGEYIPLENLLRNVIEFFNLPSSFTLAGDAQQPALISDDWQITPLICYEIAYASLAREAAQEGNIILTISNDTWFGRSLGPKQHLQIAQFRALETGRYVMRATNNGFTGIINNRGQITTQAPAFETTSLTSTAASTVGITPIVWMGHLVVILVLFGLLGIVWFLGRKK